MERSFFTMRYILPIALSTAMAAGPAFADKPSWAGAGKGENRVHKEGRDGNRDGKADREGDGRDRRFERHFGDRHRAAVRDYYAGEFHGGKCPPGLAKKHNGCMPPGQAKKWKLGQALPPKVAVYELPPALVVKIGMPPAGYRYVRVASDILLIAIGTNMVVDAINDLGRR